MTQIQTSQRISQVSCTTSLLVLIFFMTLSGLLSFYQGKDLDFDLAFYHFYDPYALLHHRIGFDYWPGSFFQAYITPTADFITYFLIQGFNARLATIFSGAIHGICFWLVFLIARLFTRSNWLALLLTGLGLYAPFVLSMIGKFHNDLTEAIFVLGFVLLQLRAWRHYEMQQTMSWRLNFFAALLLGIALGLKLTAMCFVVGGAAAFLLMPVQLSDRLKLIAVFATGILLGDLLASGYWMWIMWQKFHNPLYPFFNNIFHSPDFPAKNWRYTEYVPTSFMRALFFPFYFSWRGTLIEYGFRDIRYVVLYLLLLLGAAVWLQRKIMRQQSALRDYLFIWLTAFFIISFAANEYYFSILRYLATLEMLAPLLIFLLIQKVFSDQLIRSAAFFACAYAIVLMMVPMPNAREPWYVTSYFDQTLPAVTQKISRATVLTAYPAFTLRNDPRPQMFLIPYFPSQWRFIGVPFANFKYDSSDEIAKHKIAALMRENKDPVFLLTARASMSELIKAASVFNLAPAGKCEYVPSHRAAISRPVILCPVKKKG